jgi:hypothetical protein
MHDVLAVPMSRSRASASPWICEVGQVPQVAVAAGALVGAALRHPDAASVLHSRRMGVVGTLLALRLVVELLDALVSLADLDLLAP